MTETMLLEVDGLSSGYGRGAVVHDVSLEVRAGEVVTLLGANGAGKTTTILSIAGLLAPTAGRMQILGQDEALRRRPSRATVVRRARRGLAVVPDDRGLVADLTVGEHLRLSAPRRHAERLRDEELAEWFPALVPLHRRKAGLLSGGEQQMLALARALAGRPKLLVIDEMSMGLAPLVARHLLEVMGRIANETGIGVLVVEQHVHLALEVADRGYVLRRGRVVLEGTATDLAEHRSAIEAGYLGD